jgi:hypothetical protein
MGDAAFNKDIEDEIHIPCKYYNEFIGPDDWGEDDHTVTMMTVLNKYDMIKAGGHGNFARFITSPTPVVPPLSQQEQQ